MSLLTDLFAKVGVEVQVAPEVQEAGFEYLGPGAVAPMEAGQRTSGVPVGEYPHVSGIDCAPGVCSPSRATLTGAFAPGKAEVLRQLRYQVNRVGGVRRRIIQGKIKALERELGCGGLGDEGLDFSD